MARFSRLNKFKFYKYIGYILIFALSLFLCFKTIPQKYREGMTDDTRKGIDDAIAPIKERRAKCKQNCLNVNNGDKKGCLIKCYDKCTKKCPNDWAMFGGKPNCSDKKKYPEKTNQRSCQNYKEMYNYVIDKCDNACGRDPSPIDIEESMPDMEASKSKVTSRL